MCLCVMSLTFVSHQLTLLSIPGHTLRAMRPQAGSLEARRCLSQPRPCPSFWRPPAQDPPLPAAFPGLPTFWGPLNALTGNRLSRPHGTAPPCFLVHLSSATHQDRTLLTGIPGPEHSVSVIVDTHPRGAIPDRATL